MKQITKLGIPKIKPLGLGDKNGIHNKGEKHLEDFIKEVYWVSTRQNGSIPVSKALLGEKVTLIIKTKDVPNNTAMLVRIYEYNKITKNKKLFDKDIIIYNNVGKTEELYLEKNQKWLDLLKETGEENELELYAEISCWGESIDKGKYLNVKNSDKTVVFFIGGAADKSSYGIVFKPNQNILPVKKHLDRKILNKIDYNSYYLGFDEVYDVPSQTNRLEENVLQYLDKNSSIYIVGHSLGGWNGAHLSQILTDKGYNVEMLITLDPVGEGFLVYMASSIYKNKPKPKAKFWINILADPLKPDESDDVAELGERWKIVSGTNINVKLDKHHEEADGMFRSIIKDKKSSCDFIEQSIISKIGK